MPKALSREEVALRRMMGSSGWYNAGQAAIQDQLRRIGVSGSPSAGTIDWGGVTNAIYRGILRDQERQAREQRMKEISAYYNDYYTRSGVAGQAVNRFGAAETELDELYRRVQNQKAQAERVGLETEEGPSFLQIVFDILQRGQYTVAEGARQAREAERAGDWMSIDEFFRGAREGITARAKTSWADVIEEEGVTGTDLGSRITRGVGGFLGDVFLDPTTYIGAGIVKKASKEAIEAAGTKAVQEALTSNPIVTQIGRNAVAAATKANKGRILPRIKQNQIFNKAVETQLPIIRKFAEEQAIEQGPGRIALKLFGKEVGTSSGLGRQISEAAYRGLSRVGDRVVSSTVGGALNKAFRTRAVMPGRLHMFDRVFKARGISDLEGFFHTFRQTYKAVSKEDAAQITRGLMDGIDLSGMKVADGALDAGQIQADIRKLYDSYFEAEKRMGFRTASDYVQDYVPRYARKGLNDARSKWHNSLTGSLDDARKMGVTPVEDFRELVAHRTARFFQRKSQFDLVKSLEDSYGVRLYDEKIGQRALTGRSADAAGLAKINHVSADGNVRVPQAVADYVDEMKKLVDDPEYASDLLRIYDKVLSTWKTMVTVVSPGFHVRNTIGDVFLNWLDDVKSPLSYQKASKVIGNGKLGKNVDIGGLTVPIEDVQYLFHHAGLNVGFYRVDIQGEFGMRKLMGGVEKARKASEARENWARMAHFINVMEKEIKTKGVKLTRKNFRDKLSKIAIDAGEQVRKFNIDYGDLTAFEKRFGKRFIPFYTWVRKSTPLLLEAVALQPGKIAKLPKGKRAIEEILGTGEVDQQVEDSVPKWLKEYSALRVAGGDEPDYLFGGSVIPIQQWGEFTNPSDIARFAASSATPAAQIPFEQATGTEIYSGRDVDDDLGRYLLNKLGAYPRLLGKATGEYGASGRDIVNLLTGIGYQDVPEYRQEGELYRQEEYLRELLKKKRKDLEGQLQ